MTQFKVFTHPRGASEAVKQGWSWPAFFFTWIWALCKRQYLLGGLMFGGLVGVGLLLGWAQASGAPEHELLSVRLLSLGVQLVFGKYGNRWREKNLIARGYDDAGFVGADNSEKAVSAYLETARAPGV
ncbi:hypothetical protein BTHE68_56590 [Burkholderia sp. THE68]|uniref:DUF2628 domain-containing protein n=1 Tax=Burkholderia sp. THE68 TaxID=758782 RepID=UPI001316AEFB|nr:DUF2628 domain-containing protein [Burkholderia sp. THE68]BBU31925.1 hypothetical protein BTHE68_56590 [Burkholderia sp. THE68]